MTATTRGRRTIGILLLLVVAVLVWGFSCSPRAVQSRSTTEADVAGPDRADSAFSVSGRVSGSVAPGGGSRIDVEFTNRLDDPLEVRDLAVSLREVVAPDGGARGGCRLEDFRVDQGDVSGLVVGPGAQVLLSETDRPRRSWPRLRMVAGRHNQDGCKGAGLVLALEVRGEPA